MTADVAPLTPEELAEARTRHTFDNSVDSVYDFCTCGVLWWHCDAARAIATVDALNDEARKP